MKFQILVLVKNYFNTVEDYSNTQLYSSCGNPMCVLHTKHFLDKKALSFKHCIQSYMLRPMYKEPTPYSEQWARGQKHTYNYFCKPVAWSLQLHDRSMHVHDVDLQVHCVMNSMLTLEGFPPQLSHQI